MQKPDLRVLLIDDDEDDYIIIRDLLREINTYRYILTWKSSYESGLEALNSKNYDICLLDFKLGEQSGLDLLEKLNSDFCPIILLTGFGDMELDLKAMRMGAADYLVKEKLIGPVLEKSIRYAHKRGQDIKALREQKENFKTLFNSTFEGIFVIRDGLIQDVNEAAGSIFGVSPKEMLNTQLIDLIRTDRRDVFKKDILENRTTGLECIGVKKDGTEVPLLVASRNLVLQSENAILVAIRDVSQRKQMEAQILRQDRLASLGLLASSLAHEIGTPLGVIRGRAQFISDRSKEMTIKEDMGLITSQIDRISKLVNSLLNLAREKKSSVAIPVNVALVLDDVTRLLKHELERSDIKLDVVCGKDQSVLAEAGPLGQVLLNLLVNSVYAIDEAKKKDRKDGHKISIRVENDGLAKIILVEDTGNGIEEKNLKHLFKPFFTTKDVGVGTGLGLATSYKIVQSWGGSMDVSSRIGQGTLFKLRLKNA
ncbi:MAG: hypothetical protein A4S09_03825 [Proteobacteria bacterium SG_bin7]|nr:MAG: hypothetical protein A4S09_03825 [Proteobacteria bacterium SG_bin7]